MNKQRKVNRRDFLKMTGLASLSLPSAKVFGRKGKHDSFSSQEQYGGFLIKRHARGKPPYQVDASSYQRFSEKNIMFSRNIWDPICRKDVRKYQNVPIEHMKNNDPGYGRLEFAFARIAWNSNEMPYYGWESRFPLAARMEALGMSRWEPKDLSAQEVTDIIKKIALFYGASLVGIAEFDERWFYSHAFAPRIRGGESTEKMGSDEEMMQIPVKTLEVPILFEDAERPVRHTQDNKVIIPKSLKYVISLAIEMDSDAYETGPTCIAAAATGNGYSRMAISAGTLAEFIRGLGYSAAPMGNDTALSIPIAIDAGLGELGRNGLMITPKYGPRVRLCKVFTDMPLVPDSPITFGVTEFCEICGKCAKFCPSSAIITGQRTYEPHELSNNPGVYKWPVNAYKCHTFWKQNGTDCSVCIRVCPFNKPSSWLHDAARILIGAKSGTIDKAILALDNASGYGAQADPRAYWKKNHFIHIKT